MHSSPPAEHGLTSPFLDEGMDENTFSQSALELFQYQYSRNITYRNYCDTLNKNPDNILGWSDIPAVTTDVFKFPDSNIISFPDNQIERTFMTSGTTSDLKGQHHFPSLDTYEQSIITCWEESSLPRPSTAIYLTVKPQDAPHSSLSHMMGVLDAHYSKDSLWAIGDDGEMAIDKIIETIKHSKRPIAILGTALAFLHLFENTSYLLPLPPGSWAMETGGYKGTNRTLEKAELYELFQQHLGLEPDSVINEYSMTELSSQFYTRGLGKEHQGPSWTRIQVIDPLTEKEALANQPGHLVIYDLANIHSVLAIRTQDIAIATGGNSFILLGRDPSALPRGCSRAADSTLRS